MKMFVRAWHPVVAIAAGLTLAPVAAAAQSVKAVQVKPAAKPATISQPILNTALLSRPLNTKAEALVLLRQMRVASAELRILIQQNARASERLRHKDRAVQVRSVATLVAVRADLDAAISRWEKKLGSVGDDAQLANIDLQTMLRKQQQTLQTISNVSKMLHDTAMAIIRKIG
jgi:hypothetical protein